MPNLNPLLDLDRISFNLIERYLEAINATKIFDDPTDVTVFETSTGQQIVFPRNKKFRDYKQVLSTAISEFSRLLNKDETDLILDIIFPSDIIHIRVDDRVTEYGTIPLSFSNDITMVSQQLIKEEAQRLIYKIKTKAKTNKKEIVRKFVDSCRFGQTEVGSYCYSIILPLEIDNINYQTSLDKSNPFSRNVFVELFKNIEISVDAADSVTKTISDEVREIFVEHKKIVKNILYLEPPSEDGLIEFLPVPSANIILPTGMVRPISISHKQFSNMNHIAREVYKDDYTKHSTFVGKIDKLMGREHKEGGREGEVGFTTIGVDNRYVKAKLYLNPADYLKANKSHGSNKFVSLTGLLVKLGPKSYEIQDISDFKILDEEQ